MELGLGQGGYARPTEVAEFLTKGQRVVPAALPFHRMAMFRAGPDGSRIDAMDL
jgi:hypothetical protein